MASGKNHDLSILFTSPIILGGGIHYFGLNLGIIAGAAHFLGGMYLSPDLDLVSRPYKRWGYLRWIWIPYQEMIPRHRHFLSHGLVIGSLVRLLYLGVLISPLVLALPGLREMDWAGMTWGNAIAFFLGVELSALNHLLLDGMLVPLPGGIKKALKGN